MMNLRISRIGIVLYISAIICALACIVKGAFVLGFSAQKAYPGTEKEYKATEDFKDGWSVVLKDGTKEPLTYPAEFSCSKDETLVFTKNVDSNEVEGKVLFFDNPRYGAAVYAGNELIVSMNMSSFAKTVRGNFYVEAYLPEDTEYSELKVVFSGFRNGKFEFPEMMIGSRAGIAFSVLMMERANIAILFMLLIVGLICAVSYILMRSKNIDDNRIGSLFIFLVLALIWGVTDSYIPQLYNLPLEISSLFCYLALMALPMPLLAFVRNTFNPESKEILLVETLSFINIIVQNLLGLFGIVPLHDMIGVSHGFCVMAIVTGFVSIERNRSDKKGYQEHKLFYASIVAISAFAASAIVIYWFAGGYEYHICLMIGFLAFVCLIMADVFARFLHITSQKQQQAFEIRLYERMSMYDKLSGLKNRRAYEKKLEEIKADKENDAIIVVCDVNGLKHTNDNFGHQAGDVLIVTAAKAIKAAYSEYGECFRVGGDEFCAILTKNIKDIKNPEKLGRDKVEEFNKDNDIKLSMAIGFSHLLRPDGSMKTAEEWIQEADINMYRDKIKGSLTNKKASNNTYHEVMEFIIRIIESRDIYTAHHSVRVRDLSVAIGGMLGISEATLQNLEAAAYIHDIGKIGISDAILLSDKKLTDEEFEIIKHHPHIGASIIAKTQASGEISNIVLSHHERYDGNGYPNGRKGIGIPLEARIIAIADSIDAMTSKRSYRDALSFDKCRSEIEKCSGTMYDPAIAKIVLDNWDSIASILQSYSDIED